MSVSRRKFLRSGAVLSAVLLLKPGSFVVGQNSLWSNQAADNAINPGRGYSREMFAPYVGDVFRVRVGKQIVDLKLASLTDAEPVSSGITTGKIARTDCFSLRFYANSPLHSTATIRQLNHPKLGTIDLFLSQSKQGSGFFHTAIVNHLV
jgi:hypothetical protein